MDSWAVSACYPRSTFYPLSDGLSIQNHRITKTCFRTCSTCPSRSQAPFCLCTPRAISDRAEGTIALLRYSLGGDRPSQTTHHARSLNPVSGSRLEPRVFQGGISRWLHRNWRSGFSASHLSYTRRRKIQCKAVVKVHGVFPSCRGYAASSQRFQFHGVSGGDSVAIVTPFVQVGTYPTRNFATLGPL
jgi:hypothetical protein